MEPKFLHMQPSNEFHHGRQIAHSQEQDNHCLHNTTEMIQKIPIFYLIETLYSSLSMTYLEVHFYLFVWINLQSAFKGIYFFFELKEILSKCFQFLTFIHQLNYSYFILNQFAFFLSFSINFLSILTKLRSSFKYLIKDYSIH